MRTEDALILAQWLSPAFPVGAFAYSHGLETAVQDGVVWNGGTLQAWLEDVLWHGTGANDAILVAAAYTARNEDELDLADASARAFAASAERLREGLLMGSAFTATVLASHGITLPDLVYPVALGRAARLAKLPLEPVQAMYLQAFVSNIVSAAVRLIPLGQTEGQAVLGRLAPQCGKVAAKVRGRGLDDLGGTAFLSDVAAMRHETLNIRLFRS
ncbi:urease accessory protein UreF [Defluviimonas sp. WL0002]|uniref:Urease accessory protein UreF n=1 Tax=Albidovulum marisflavi TaxID=2984159 RepID=A0ABT2ZC18_9RHOB|nr:urease accessory UreF family protein [Defluviimonas sp. WL0002]MCV2868694.1 urease accessory protein UreF [Defluviimonas sp. WL0002]